MKLGQKFHERLKNTISFVLSTIKQKKVRLNINAHSHLHRQKYIYTRIYMYLDRDKFRYRCTHIKNEVIFGIM